MPLRTMMDRLMESAFTPSFWIDDRTSAGGYGMDVYERDDAYAVHCLLPEISPDAVNVSVQSRRASGSTPRLRNGATNR